jgi:hypothetical protein
MIAHLAGQLARTQIRQPERGFQDYGLFLRPQPIPHRSRRRLAIHQSGFALLAIAPLPTIERRTRQPQFRDGRLLRLRRPPHQLDQLAFLLGTQKLDDLCAAAPSLQADEETATTAHKHEKRVDLVVPKQRQVKMTTEQLPKSLGKQPESVALIGASSCG